MVEIIRRRVSTAGALKNPGENHSVHGAWVIPELQNFQQDDHTTSTTSIDNSLLSLCKYNLLHISLRKWAELRPNDAAGR